MKSQDTFAQHGLDRSPRVDVLIQMCLQLLLEIPLNLLHASNCERNVSEHLVRVRMAQKPVAVQVINCVYCLPLLRWQLQRVV